MKFKKLHIRNFKCFKDRIVEFGDGLNIVFGPNESGKSTIYQALVISLFGFSEKTRSRHFGSLKRKDFSPLDTGMKPFLYLEFFRGQTLLSIERDLSEPTIMISKDVNKSDVKSEKLKIEAARDYIKDLLGGIDEEIFQNYASISHYELSKLDAGSYRAENESMGELLIKIVESRKGEGLTDVKKRIDGEVNSIKKETTKSNNDLNVLNELLQKAQADERKLNDLKKVQKSVVEKLDEKKKRCADLKTVIDSARRRFEKEKDIRDFEDRLNRDNDELRRLTELADESSVYEKQLREFPSEIRDKRDALKEELDIYYNDKTSIQARKETISNQRANLLEELRRLQKNFDAEYSNFKKSLQDIFEYKEKDNRRQPIESNISALEREMNVVSREIDEDKNKKRIYQTYSIGSIAIAVILLTLAVVVNLKILHYPILVIMLVFAVISLGLYLKGKKAIDESKIESLQAKSFELTNLESELAELKSYLTQIANRLGFSSRAELDEIYSKFQLDERNIQNKFEELERLDAEISKIEKSEEALVKMKNSLFERTGYHTLIDLENALVDYIKLEVRLSELERRIEKENVKEKLRALSSKITQDSMILEEKKKAFEREFIGATISESDFVLKNAELSEIEDEIIKLTEEKNGLDGEIRGRESDIGESVEELEEQIDRTQKTIRALYLKSEEIEYLKNIIGTLETEFYSETLPEIERRALNLFRSLAGKSDKTFSLAKWPVLEISSTALSGFEEKHLSQGTRDQLYFALRISWSEILTPENLKLPFLWDDPFVYWDRERTKGICEITKKFIESGHQLIIFTHRDDLLESFNEIFSSNEMNLISL